MFRTDEQMADRDRACEEITTAFGRAQVGSRHQRQTGADYSEVGAWLNYGFGGQRRVIVMVHDDGLCRVCVSQLYDVPEGKTGDDVLITEPLSVLFTIAVSPQETGDELVRRVRAATFEQD